jgi:hypothetical protein
MKILKEKKYRILQIVAKYGVIIVLFVIPLIYTSAATGITGSIANPLGTTGPQDIPSFIQAILNVVLVVGVPIVTLAIIYTGYLFVAAQGNPTKLTEAKKTLLYSLIGAALLLGSFVISSAIKGTVDNIISNQ